MRRSLVLALCALLVGASFAAWPSPVSAQKRQRVELPEGTILAAGARPVITPDGGVGFVAPAVGDTVVAFAVRTGEVLGRLEGLGAASGLSLHEGGERRLLVLTFPNDPRAGQPAAVVVVDATDASALSVVATFRLPEALELAPGARAELARGQKFGVVPIVAPVAAVLSFDVATGQQVGALTLDGAADRISLVEAGDEARLAVASAAANEVAVVSLADNGVLLPLSTFSPPEDAPISTANNVVFDASGKVGYVASLRGRALMSFSLETGELVDRLGTDGSSAGIAVYHTADRDVVAVANVSRPGGAADEAVAPKADEPPLGLPGAVVVDADPAGHLAARSRFYPETGEELAPANNPEFSADGSSVFVPARTGSLYVVDAATGEARSRESLDNRVQSIAAAPLAEAVAVVSAGGSEGHIDIVPTAIRVAEEPKPETADGDGVRRADAERSDDARRRDAASPPAIDHLNPTSVQAGRRRDLPVTVVGSGFGAGATVVIGEAQYSAAVSANGKRANFTLSAALLAAPATVAVQVKNPDGTLSNAVTLAVVSPFAPLVQKIHPGEIPSGVDGVDLKIRGDHFRDGAVASVTYTDATGAVLTAELRTYRLGFTSLVARLPQKLTRRAEQFALTVTDRDGATASEAVPLNVVGPAVAGVTPERIIAGDVGGGETLALHVSGSNFHQDAVVFVKRPLRGSADDGSPFRLVPAANVRWKSDTKLVVKLTGLDVAYSGTLVVRVVNPVPGERRKNGDASDHDFTVAGPVITTTAPDVILAGTDSLVLKLTGTDFRRTAVVKFQRETGGEAQKRVAVVDDPNFKGRKQINVQLASPELLRLVAKPGTLTVRVINPSVGKGDPSPAATLEVVGPGILSYELLPSEGDPSAYRLKLTGEHFAEGAVVQLYDAGGNPVGRPVETRPKSGEELVVLLDRARVTNLRTFKVVVFNPGGPYNDEGVASNPIDVTVN